jgi:hypothetical protein
MPTDPAMLARSIGTLNDLELIRISPAPCRRPSWRPSRPTATAGLPGQTPERGSGTVTTA